MLITRSVARCRKTWKKLGVAPFTPHDLRRTCRTGLARLKIPSHIAERVVNHAPEKIEGTCDVHDYATEKRDALEQWEAHLTALVTPTVVCDRCGSQPLISAGASGPLCV